MNAACGWTLIRKTSLLRKINPMMRRSSFTNKEHLQLPHLAMNERRNVPGDSDWHRRIASQIPNSDQSPLYDVRNPAGASCKGQRMRSDVSRTMFLKGDVLKGQFVDLQFHLVEPDGIEPTTSCLQSTRSPS
jgi:hypothetical protein